jgi:PAS domain S-box-containing protein
MMDETSADRAKLQLIFDELSEGIITSSPDGALLSWNTSAVEMHGFTSMSEVTGALVTFRDLFELTTREGVVLTFEEWPLARILRGDTLRAVELRVRRRGGGRGRFLSYSGRLARDANGDPTLALLGITDVTERRETEAALERSHTQLCYLVENAPHCMAMLDRQMNYVATSARWIQEYGGGETGLVGKNLYETSQHIPDSWRNIHRAAEAGEGQKNDDEVGVRADGSRYWISWTAYPWTDVRGEIGGVITCVEDISARKLAVEAAQFVNDELDRRVDERTAELRAANEELDSFAYAVAHDLRAPLRALNGFSQALQEDHGHSLEPEAQDYVAEIRTAARRMVALVEGLLTLSRSTRGGNLHREPVDVSALACAIREELERGEPERSVAWEIEPGITVTGDPVTLEAVMRNLLGNAWKYTAKTAAARVRLHHESGSSFSVSDNGAGFHMDHTARLFQPFQRLHRQDEFPGLGIGLATVQRILHRHGGTVRAVGSPGLGASFTVSLPDFPLKAA